MFTYGKGEGGVGAISTAGDGRCCCDRGGHRSTESPVEVIQAPKMMHTIMAFAPSLCLQSLEFENSASIRLLSFSDSTNSRTASRKPSSEKFELRYSKIEFRHDRCKWKILGEVDGCQNIHNQVFWSHLANHQILLQSCARWQIWGAEQSYSKVGFLIKF